MSTLLLLAALATAHAAPGVAVLELYTSEGCSSCPPADRLLIKLVEEAQQQHLAVYPLAFHVDYWNRLGWPDPFSSADWSARQSGWQAHLGNRSIYTPQLVINGRAELVGSDEAAARAALQAALARPSEVGVRLEAAASGEGAVDVQVILDGLSRRATVSVMLVEDGLSTVVPRGENAGKTLPHGAVVRVMKSVNAQGPGAVSLRLAVPAGVDRARARLVAVVQDAASWAVLGAAGGAL